MTILEMQEELLANGWQWREYVFNDHLSGNCRIELTQHPSPHAFDIESRCGMDPIPYVIGWGRFSRQVCWEMAYTAIIIEEKHYPTSELQ